MPSRNTLTFLRPRRASVSGEVEDRRMMSSECAGGSGSGADLHDSWPDRIGPGCAALCPVRRAARASDSRSRGLGDAGTST